MSNAYKWGSYVLIFLLVIVTALYIHNEYMISYIRSPSMEPTYMTGDLVIIKFCSPREIHVGDVIVFRNPYNPDMLILHRVVAIKRDGGSIYFLTKGDNNPDIDPWGWVPGNLLIGKLVARVPYIGYIFLAFDEIGARILLILLIIAIGLIYVSIDRSLDKVISPLFAYRKSGILRKILTVFLLMVIFITILASIIYKNEFAVTIQNVQIKTFEQQQYLLLNIKVRSEISYTRSISQIRFLIIVQNACVGEGIWSINYPFYGTKDVSIAVLISEAKAPQKLVVEMLVEIKDFLSGSSSYIELRKLLIIE